MDIVYLLKNSPTNEELTYSLRSLVNLTHDKVFLVGGCPTNLNKSSLTHISIVQGPDKYRNTTNAIQLVCKDSRLSENFVLMNDDFFILKPIKDTINELNLTRGPIQEVVKEMVSRPNSDSPYMAGMTQTNVFLQDLGYNMPLSYELHIPMVFSKKQLLDVFLLKHLDSLSMIQWRSIYGNIYLKNSQKVEDVKVYHNFYHPIVSDKFLSTEDMSWPRVKTYISKLFPTKSKYEL